MTPGQASIAERASACAAYGCPSPRIEPGDRIRWAGLSWVHEACFLRRRQELGIR